MRRKALCVLGMHRSGTSAVAGSLIHSGISGPRTPIPAAEDNPLGFWEPVPLVQFHDELLGRFGFSWDSWDSGIDLRVQRSCDDDDREKLRSILEAEFAQASSFVLKDPRLCLTLPLLRQLCDSQGLELCPILVIRSPLEVALSLQKRDSLEIQASALIWLRYSLLAERWTRDLRRVLIPFNRFMDDSRSSCLEILSCFDIEAPPDCRALDFVSPALRHHHSEDFAQLVPDKLRELVQRVYSDLLSLAAAPDAQIHQRLDAAALALDRLLAERPELLPQRGMVTRVQLNKKAPGVLGFNLELPLAGSLIRHRMLDLLGWLLPEPTEAEPALELWQGNNRCGHITPSLAREDVALAFPDAAYGQHAGFKCRIKLDAVEPYVTLELRQRAASGEPANTGKLMAKISAWLPSLDAEVQARYLDLAARLLEQGDRLGADQALNAGIAALPADAVEAALRIAAEYRERGRSERYIDILQRILHVHPDHTETLVQLVHALAAQQQYEPALQLLRSLLRKHPLWFSLHLEMAQVLRAMQRHEEAIAHLREFLKSSPDHLEALLELASALFANGDSAAAGEHYLRALQLQPDCDPALLGLAQSLQARATLKMSSALDQLKRARQLCQQVFQLRGEARAVSSLEARIVTAIEALERANQTLPP